MSQPQPEHRPPPDELLSAYFDGELNGEELRRVEELLAGRPENRQAIDEFATLRATLRELPGRKLGVDFAERVLRRAEREMLSRHEPETVAPRIASPIPQESEAPETQEELIPSRSTLWRWPQGRRPWIYAGAAVAAALIIALIRPDTSDVRREAQMAQQVGQHAANRPREQGEISALPSEAAPVPPPSALSSSTIQPTAGKPTAPPPDTSMPAVMPAVPRPHGLAAQVRRSSDTDPGQSLRADQPTAGSKDLAGKRADQDIQRELTELGLPPAAAQWAQNAALGKRTSLAGNWPADMLIIECEIATRADTQDFLAAALADHQIALADEEAGQESETRSAKAVDHRRPGAAMARKDENEALSIQKSAADRSKPVEIVYIVAPAEQLQAALVDLGSRPGVSLKISAGPAKELDFADALPRNNLRRQSGGQGQAPASASVARDEAAAKKQSQADKPVAAAAAETPTTSRAGGEQLAEDRKSRSAGTAYRWGFHLDPSLVEQKSTDARAGAAGQSGADAMDRILERKPEENVKAPAPKTAERSKAVLPPLQSNAQPEPFQRALLIVRLRQPVAPAATPAAAAPAAPAKPE